MQALRDHAFCHHVTMETAKPQLIWIIKCPSVGVSFAPVEAVAEETFLQIEE